MQCVVYVARPPVEGEVRLAGAGREQPWGERGEGLGGGGEWVSEWILLVPFLGGLVKKYYFCVESI